MIRSIVPASRLARLAPAGFFWQSKEKRAKANKDAYIKCRNERHARGKAAWPAKGAPRTGACRDKFEDWMKLDPAAFKKYKAGGVSSIAAVHKAVDADVAKKRAAAYHLCKRKHAGRSVYPQNKKWPFKCKNEYISWQRVAAHPKPSADQVKAAELAKLSAIPVSSILSRPRPAIAAAAGAAKVQFRGDSPVAPFPEAVPTDFVPSSAEDVAAAAQEELLDMPLEEDFEDVEFDEEEEPAESDEYIEGVPNWMLAAGAVGGLGLLWFLSGR